MTANRTRLKIEAQLSYELNAEADILVALEVAPLADQMIGPNMLNVRGATIQSNIVGNAGVGRRTWLRGSGQLDIHYDAEVTVERAPLSIAGLQCSPRADLDESVVPYLWPSRYCEADSLEPFVNRTFGGAAGGAEILAMADWIFENLEYRRGASDGSTTAVDTFVRRQGVCRDFAHLMAAMARAGGVPARLVSVYAPDMIEPDFHAVVEVWLEGEWHVIDATRLADTANLARVCVGRDATDIAFMTVFGLATLAEQWVKVERV